MKGGGSSEFSQVPSKPQEIWKNMRKHEEIWKKYEEIWREYEVNAPLYMVRGTWRNSGPSRGPLAIHRGEVMSKFFQVGSFIGEQYEANMKKIWRKMKEIWRTMFSYTWAVDLEKVWVLPDGNLQIYGIPQRKDMKHVKIWRNMWKIWRNNHEGIWRNMSIYWIWHSHIGSGTWKNSKLFPHIGFWIWKNSALPPPSTYRLALPCRLWDLEKF